MLVNSEIFSAVAIFALRLLKSRISFSSLVLFLLDQIFALSLLRSGISFVETGKHVLV